MQSHERTSVVEVMGRHAGHLAVYVGLSVGATAILLPEKPFDFDRDVAEHIREGKYRGKHHHLIIVAEGVGDTLGISRRIEEELGLDTRVTIIGHVQRGGSPTARDRVWAISPSSASWPGSRTASSATATPSSSARPSRRRWR